MCQWKREKITRKITKEKLAGLHRVRCVHIIDSNTHISSPQLMIEKGQRKCQKYDHHVGGRQLSL